jgi:hypothetical protein
MCIESKRAGTQFWNDLVDKNSTMSSRTMHGKRPCTQFWGNLVVKMNLFFGEDAQEKKGMLSSEIVYR